MRPVYKNIVGLVLVGVGLAILCIGALLAYDAYRGYKPITPQTKSLEEAITTTTYDLVNLAVKLGFLGVLVWSGSIPLRYGVEMVRESSVNK